MGYSFLCWNVSAGRTLDVPPGAPDFIERGRQSTAVLACVAKMGQGYSGAILRGDEAFQVNFRWDAVEVGNGTKAETCGGQQR